MDKGQFIADLRIGSEFKAVFLLASAQTQQAKNGPYWRLALRDSTGMLEAKIWFPQSQNYQDLQAGCFVEAAGRIGSYRDKPEIQLDSMRVLDESEKDQLRLFDFVSASERDPAEMLAELKELCAHVLTHAPWARFIKLVLKDDDISKGLLEAPAAMVMHHAYAGGLLEHTLSVARLALTLADLYPRLDRQALLAGAICHDLGKIWELSYGLTVDYTDLGRLLGHIMLGVEKLDPHLRKSGLEQELADHLRHMVVSHHGTREFGSPCLPATPEAIVLHYADNIDAKMNQTAGALDALQEGETWSPFIKSLDRFLYKAPKTPEEPAPAGARIATAPSPRDALRKGARKAEQGAEPAVKAEQCSLLLKE